MDRLSDSFTALCSL